MKFEISEYTLQSKQSLNCLCNTKTHKGALLKFTFYDGTIGYSDCHPWEELGDFPLSKQVELLQKGILTPLTEKSVSFAKIDAKARSQGINLLANKVIPKSHLLISNLRLYGTREFDDTFYQGYDRIKIKMGFDIKNEIEHFKNLILYLKSKNIENVKFRLDFNNCLNAEDFENFIKEIHDDLLYIEFFEDPFPFDYVKWKEFQGKYSINLACDQRSEQVLNLIEAATYLVFKPAIQKTFSVGNQNIVITSYLDHPLGELAAAYVAAETYKNNSESLKTCGLLSHKSFMSNAFSERISSNRGVLIPPSGTGFGFDDLLVQQNWKAL